MKIKQYALIILGILLGMSLIGASPSNDVSNEPTGVDKSSALVQLNGDPLSTYVKTKPPKGKKIDFSNNTVKSYRAQLSALRNDFKKWLQTNAPKANITSQYDISLNAVAVQLNGTAIEKIASAPQVKYAEYQNFYSPTDVNSDPDLSLISAQTAWTQNGGSSATAGDGIKVAIIDTGIDQSHPCFSDVNYPSVQQIGDSRFTNNKVIAAKVFNRSTKNKGYTPEALQDHGSHVAGTVACNINTPATVKGVTIPNNVTGVAPRALLGNYNVFPGEVLSASSEDILNALESAYADGFDIVNMSLGGDASGIQDLVSMAVNDLDQAGMVSAISAGNSGPGHFTVGSPGSAQRALTAGASSVGHFVGAKINNVTNGGEYAGVTGDFASVSADLTKTLKVVTEGTTVNGISLACAPLTTNLTDKIALVSRGTCTFVTKIVNASNAGAVAVLVVNNINGDGSAMRNPNPEFNNIIAYMVSLNDGLALKAIDGANIKINAALSYILSGNSDFMAGFSSQGPTDVDFRVKPDLSAPGVNVLSSIPKLFCDGNPCFAFFQGTSMAAPHLAGAAAVVKGQHLSWGSSDIRSAIVNTAEENVLKDAFLFPVTLQKDVNIIGAGRLNLRNAVNASISLDPVSISFGAVPAGSGKQLKLNLNLTNLDINSSATYTFTLGPVTGSGVSYSTPGSITISPMGTGTLVMTMTADKRASAGDHQATLRIIKNGNEIAHAVVFTLIK